MWRFFRKIRMQLMTEDKMARYLAYAIGEILLVVIGILIALQINNWNENSKTRAKELIYLSNIQDDLKLNITSLEEYIISRTQTVTSVEILLDYFEGREEVDLNLFNLHNLNVLVWYPFIQHANTYHELMNSGNFAIISNKHIKNELQDMQTNYEMIAFIENEMQQDFESYLYDPYFSIADLNAAMQNQADQKADGEGISSTELNLSEVQTLLKNVKYKNGLVLASYNSNLLHVEYDNMIKRTNDLIRVIDNEAKTK